MNGEPWLTSPVIMTGPGYMQQSWPIEVCLKLIISYELDESYYKWLFYIECHSRLLVLGLKLLIWKCTSQAFKHGNNWLIQSYENPTKSLIMHWTWVKQLKIDGNKLNNTHKSGGKVSKKIELKEHVVVHFPSRPWLTINCDGIGD